MTRADLKHCGKIPEAIEELNRSMREGRIESRHSIKSLEGMGSSSHDLGAELRMHSFTVYCDTFLSEEKVVAVVPVTSVEVTRLPDEGSLVEMGTGYTLFRSGLPTVARRIHGVGFAVRTALFQSTHESPIAIDERLMTLRLPLA